MADFLTTQSALVATLPTNSAIGALNGLLNGSSIYVGPMVGMHSTGAPGARVFTQINMATEDTASQINLQSILANTNLAALLAKLPTFSTAGAASPNVLSIQGIASGVSVPVSLGASLPAGTNAIGKLTANSGIDIGDVTVNNTSTPVLVNGLSTTVVSVKSSAGFLTGYFVYNPDTVVNYVQIFDVSGTVTLGTTPPKWSIAIPPGSGANLSFDSPLSFSNAIKVAATTTVTGSTAPGSALNANFAYSN